MELPRLQAIRNDYVSQGFEIFGIGGFSEGWPAMLPYARYYNWVFLIDSSGMPTWNAYRQNGYIPLNYVIDRNGIVRYWSEGFNEDSLRQAIEAWLQVGIEAEREDKPCRVGVSLSQNRPNPVKTESDILFTLPSSEEVRFEVYDAQGRKVRTLFQGRLTAGSHRIGFSSAGLAAAVYFYRLKAGESSLTKRLVVVR